MQLEGRPLHYNIKICDRALNTFFFRTILGMKVMRSDEFDKGSPMHCNGPYNGRWSHTMYAYGPESSYFAIGLIYNYGVKDYEPGNELKWVTIKSKEALEHAKTNNYPIRREGNRKMLCSPDGYKFHIVEERQPSNSDPVIAITLHCTDLGVTKKFWHDSMRMRIDKEDNDSIYFRYDSNQVIVGFSRINSLMHGQNFGRLSFSLPKDCLSIFTQLYKNVKTGFIDFPSGVRISVVILNDPDDLLLALIEKEGFAVAAEPRSEDGKLLEYFIANDQFQDK